MVVLHFEEIDVMKAKLGLHLQQSDTQELQLICNLCGQPYYPNEAWEDQIEATIFGAEKYALCLLCTQTVPDAVVHDEAYRQRWRYKLARLRELFKARASSEPSPSEPTYEQLRVQVEELQAQERKATLRFLVAKKGGISVYGLGRFPVTLYYEQWMLLLNAEQGLRQFMDANESKLKRKR